MSEVERVSLSLDRNLLNQLSRLVAERGYENRSEYIRDLIRDQLTKERWENDEEVIGTLTLIYNHLRPGITEKLVNLQHFCSEKVLGSTHIHLSKEICAEMIMLQGKGSAIANLADASKRLLGVLHAELSVVTTGKEIS